jgi:hypothetical protein
MKFRFYRIGYVQSLLSKFLSMSCSQQILLETDL